MCTRRMFGLRKASRLPMDDLVSRCRRWVPCRREEMWFQVSYRGTHLLESGPHVPRSFLSGLELSLKCFQLVPGGFHLCPDTLSFFVKSVKTGCFLPSECSETVSLDWRISLLVYLRARERISHINNVFIHKYYAMYHQKDREKHVLSLYPTVYRTLRPKKNVHYCNPVTWIKCPHLMRERAQKKFEIKYI